ncbi:hypothetical protein CEXT_739781 [Caerostris extrusa]|uniref:Uncharacterized protein n=1 Tax=Caerostris extrusa TaxID=172846 RepID=A0AAV4U8R1_CAEEX|nr:hypothetical protein CEXT_739781 [Caerostris extrusa]
MPFRVKASFKSTSAKAYVSRKINSRFTHVTRRYQEEFQVLSYHLGKEVMSSMHLQDNVRRRSLKVLSICFTKTHSRFTHVTRRYLEKSAEGTAMPFRVGGSSKPTSAKYLVNYFPVRAYVSRKTHSRFTHVTRRYLEKSAEGTAMPFRVEAVPNLHLPRFLNIPAFNFRLIETEVLTETLQECFQVFANGLVGVLVLLQGCAFGLLQTRKAFCPFKVDCCLNGS